MTTRSLSGLGWLIPLLYLLALNACGQAQRLESTHEPPALLRIVNATNQVELWFEPSEHKSISIWVYGPNNRSAQHLITGEKPLILPSDMPYSSLRYAFTSGSTLGVISPPQVLKVPPIPKLPRVICTQTTAKSRHIHLAWDTSSSIHVYRIFADGQLVSIFPADDKRHVLPTDQGVLSVQFESDEYRSMRRPIACTRARIE